VQLLPTIVRFLGLVDIPSILRDISRSMIWRQQEAQCKRGKTRDLFPQQCSPPSRDKQTFGIQHR